MSYSKKNFVRKGVHGVKTGFELLESIAGISLKDHSNDERSNEEMVMATEETLARWRESGVYSDKMFEFLWHQSSIRDTILQVTFQSFFFISSNYFSPSGNSKEFVLKCL